MTQIERPKYREHWPRGNVDYLDGVADLSGVAIDNQPIAATFDRVTYFPADWFGAVTTYVDEDGLTHYQRSWRTTSVLTDADFPTKRDHVLVFCRVTDTDSAPVFPVGKLTLI